MSTNIVMYPSRNGIDLPTDCPQHFIKHFSAVFGEPPCTISDGNLLELSVAARMYEGDGDNPFEEIYDYLAEHGGEVRIVAEY